MKDTNKEFNATVNTGGRVTIPKPIRDRLDLKPGCKIRWERNQAGEIVLRSSRPKE